MTKQLERGNHTTLEEVLKNLLIERSESVKNSSIEIEFPYIRLNEMDLNKFDGKANFIFRTTKDPKTTLIFLELTHPLETSDVVEISDNRGIEITWKFDRIQISLGSNGIFTTTLHGDLKGAIFKKSTNR